jgi:CelD/BcsL family acetyltransferase involved in cellulose biosynthesis
LHLTVLKEVPEDPQLAASWNALVMRMERPEVFYTHQWALAASRAFRETVQPFLCLLHEGTELCGVAALATLSSQPQATFFLTASTADYCNVISLPAMRQHVLSAVVEELRRRQVETLTLANVPQSSETFDQLRKIAASNRFHLYERAAYDCGLILLGDNAERQALLRSIRRKDREKRGLKRMAEMGEVRLSQVTGESLEPELEAIFSAQISRFLATGRVSPLVRPERRLFLSELSQRLAQAGWLRISRLQIGELAVAWNLGFRYCDSWFWYLPTFDIQYQDFSPGSCLLRLLTEEAAADVSIERLDLGLGDEAYKERFANGIFSTRHVVLTSSLMQHGKIATRHQIVKGVGSLRMEEPVRRTRDAVRRVQKRVRTSGLVGTVAHGSRRAAKLAVSNDEIRVFEAPPLKLPSVAGSELTALDWRHLSDAAIRNAEDEETLNYLMRCALRLRESSASGYILQAPGSQGVHFLWIGQYDGFHLSELDYTLPPSDPDAAIIFDCWTPALDRGHSYYAEAIRLAAERLLEQGKKGWIFSAAENESSLRGIAKAGFLYRFSLIRRKRLGRTSVTRVSDAN